MEEGEVEVGEEEEEEVEVVKKQQSWLEWFTGRSQTAPATSTSSRSVSLLDVDSLSALKMVFWNVPPFRRLRLARTRSRPTWSTRRRRRRSRRLTRSLSVTW